MITNAVEEFIYQNHHHKLTGWNAHLLGPVKLEEYAEAVAAKGSPLRNCFKYINGTVEPISPPWWPRTANPKIQILEELF